jgi:hypothetical protein
VKPAGTRSTQRRLRWKAVGLHAAGWFAVQGAGESAFHPAFRDRHWRRGRVQHFGMKPAMHEQGFLVPQPCRGAAHLCHGARAQRGIQPGERGAQGGISMYRASAQCPRQLQIVVAQ